MPKPHTPATPRHRRRTAAPAPKAAPVAHPAPKPLPAATLARLVRVVGCKEVGFAVEVHGLFGGDELQTRSLPLAHALCRTVRAFVRALPPARQHTAFDRRATDLAQMGRQP